MSIQYWHPLKIMASVIFLTKCCQKKIHYIWFIFSPVFWKREKYDLGLYFKRVMICSFYKEGVLQNWAANHVSHFPQEKWVTSVELYKRESVSFTYRYRFAHTEGIIVLIFTSASDLKMLYNCINLNTEIMKYCVYAVSPFLLLPL